MTTEIKTIGFWVSTNGRYWCDIINEGTEVVMRAFSDGHLRDEFEAFIAEKISHLTAWSFIMQDGDFRSAYEDWIEDFINSKTSQVFVEGKDTEFQGANYHWETAEIPMEVSFWDFADKHEDEYFEKYRSEAKPRQ